MLRASERVIPKCPGCLQRARTVSYTTDNDHMQESSHRSPTYRPHSFTNWPSLSFLSFFYMHDSSMWVLVPIPASSTQPSVSLRALASPPAPQSPRPALLRLRSQITRRSCEKTESGSAGPPRSLETHDPDPLPEKLPLLVHAWGGEAPDRELVCTFVGMRGGAWTRGSQPLRLRLCGLYRHRARLL